MLLWAHRWRCSGRAHAELQPGPPSRACAIPKKHEKIGLYTPLSNTKKRQGRWWPVVHGGRQELRARDAVGVTSAVDTRDGTERQEARLVAPHRAMAWLRAGSIPTGAVKKLWTKSASSSQSGNSSVERPIHVSDDMDTERMGMASSGDASNSP